MTYLISYHKYLVELLLFIIVINIVVQIAFRANFERLVKFSRIGYFVFWAFWAMVAFSGLVIFAFQKGALSNAVMVMIISIVLLPVLDGYRAIKVGRLWRQDNKGIKLSIAIMVAEIAVIAATIVYTVMAK